MLLPAPHGTERIEGLASRLGCTVGQLTEPHGEFRPALLGSVGSFAASLREFGGGWDPTDKVYFFASWPMLEAALRHVVDERERARLTG